MKKLENVGKKGSFLEQFAEKVFAVKTLWSWQCFGKNKE